MHRREFLQNAAALTAGGATWPQRGQAGEIAAATKPRRATLAQVAVHKNVEQNLVSARGAIEQAVAEKGDVVLFPEMFLTGYARDIRQKEAAAGMAEIAEMCRKSAVTALVGTAWGDRAIRTRINFRCLATRPENWLLAACFYPFFSEYGFAMVPAI